MAARSPRKLFASSFVVTLAAIPACGSPPPSQPPVSEPAPAQGSDHASPAPAGATGVITNPPPPQPAPPSANRRWTIWKQQTGCVASVEIKCPLPQHEGDPAPTCNPPPPMSYACPADWDGKSQLVVVQYANTEGCVIEPPPMKCPPNTPCNPPPPRPVPCPTRE
jgi:hypothetical protein